MPKPVEDEAEEEYYMPQLPEETVEPFSNEWEPEYEQPIGEYIPLEPIPFRPRSRLHELKRKLVEGPERRYYELSELGLGKLQIAIFLNLLVAVLAAGSTVMYALDVVHEDRLRSLVFCQFLATLLSALLGSYQLMEGVGDLFLRRRFSLNTLLVCSLFACVADGILCLRQLRVPCCAAFSLHTFMSLWGAYHKRNTEMGQMDTMRKATRLNRVVKAPDCYEGKPGFFVEDGEVEDFMEVYNQISGPEKAMNLYALIAVVLSSAIGVMAGLSGGTAMGVRIGSAALLAAMPATAFISMTRPMAVLERRMHKLGAVICGWPGAKACSGKAVVPLTDFDLFPGGSVKVNGVKFYSQRDPDDTVAYATALIEYSGMGIASLFTQLLDSRGGEILDAEDFRIVPDGLAGEVSGETCVLGLSQCLKEQGVEIPESAQISNALYFAIDGVLTAVFALNYSRTKASAAGLVALNGCRKLRPMILCRNFMITPQLIREKFGIKPRRYDFPDPEVRDEFASFVPDPKLVSGALTTQQNLSSAAYAVSGAKALRTSSWMGLWLHLLAGVVGLLVMAALAYLGDMQLLSPFNILLYQLVWLIPGLLFTEWTRTV